MSLLTQSLLPSTCLCLCLSIYLSTYPLSPSIFPLAHLYHCLCYNRTIHVFFSISISLSLKPLFYCTPHTHTLSLSISIPHSLSLSLYLLFSPSRSLSLSLSLATVLYPPLFLSRSLTVSYASVPSITLVSLYISLILLLLTLLSGSSCSLLLVSLGACQKPSPDSMASWAWSSLCGSP